MIKIRAYKKGNIRWGSLEDIPSCLCLIDCINPSDVEIEKISKHTGISIDDIHEAIDPAERPRVMELPSYSLIIFRAPVASKKDITTTPVAMFFNQKTVICIRHTKVSTLDKLYSFNEMQQKKFYEGSMSYLVYWIIDDILNSFFSLMDTLEDRINHVEGMIYKSPKEHMIKEIFSLKKILIYFHKALTANREVINAVEKEYLSQVSRKDIKRFRNTYNDVVELLDMESTYRDILTGVMDIYLTSVSNNLNVIIKKMTAMGSFILIPTLITGIYGMNFQHLPEVAWKYGYAFALGLMVVSVVLLYIYFKKEDWL